MTVGTTSAMTGATRGASTPTTGTSEVSGQDDAASSTCFMDMVDTCTRPHRGALVSVGTDARGTRGWLVARMYRVYTQLQYLREGRLLACLLSYTLTYFPARRVFPEA
jgi:hypothetical protein